MRVVSGSIVGEGPKWNFRESAADDLVVDGVVTIQHGSSVGLRLRIVSDDIGRSPRPNHAVVTAVEVGSAAEVEVSVPTGELIRFGIEGL